MVNLPPGWRQSKLTVLAGIVGGLVVARAIQRRFASKAIAMTVPTIIFSKFLKDVEEGRIHKVLMGGNEFLVYLREHSPDLPRTYRTTIVPMLDGSELVRIFMSKNITFGSLRQSFFSRLAPFIIGLLPFIYLALTYRMLGRIMGSGDDRVGKQGKPSAEKRRDLVDFSKVAGVDEAKAELVELVDFLKNPAKYRAIGAKLPKGLLLSGPSGTGKTLLARALATEAGVPFISCSASDFVEMLVGRGAARIRDLFTRAAENAPCIIFIDELDALAKARGGLNSNDEREQTLNQLLTEMDGFEGRGDIIVVAATNRPEVLDAALCRPGRFDRHVVVGLPDEQGRKEILKVHTQGVKIEGVVLDEIARCTEGRSGAELASLVNDAALLAVRSGNESVTAAHFAAALARAHKARTAMSFLWT